MKMRPWYQARIRWAEMVEGRGIRHWEEGLYLFRSEDREAAFRRALEIGEGGQSGGEEQGRRTRWVETRLAEVVTLDCLGHELEEEPLEVHWMRLPATEKIAFDHKFEPANKEPATSR
jgi:hypothetical protein